MFLASIWLLIGFVFCSIVVFGGSVYLVGQLIEKYKLPTIVGTAAMIPAIIITMWIFKFFFVLPIFSMD
tara:strand:+ start:300 stop:506 length:207 start_codon:yes stop_codon:yes gene_type:complete